MKKQVLMLKENKTGITLIALVITIIVLLILATVSIQVLTGDNRIINQVKISIREEFRWRNRRTD